MRNRVVWIDVFAVRQWPGNGADLDFRGVLEGCTAAIVAAAPIEGTLLKEDGDSRQSMSRGHTGGTSSAAVQLAGIATPACQTWQCANHAKCAVVAKA